MSEYTPTTDDILEEWIVGSVDEAESRAQFNRWMDTLRPGRATDAEVKAVAKAIRWALPGVDQAQLEVEAHGILAALRAASEAGGEGR